MSNVSLLIPKSNRPVWSAELEAVALTAADMVEIPLLGYITAGSPVELNESQERVAVPAHHGAQEYLRPARARPFHDR